MINDLLGSGIKHDQSYRYSTAERILNRPNMFNRKSLDKVLGGKLLARANPHRELNFKQILLGLIYSNEKHTRVFTQYKKDFEKIIDEILAKLEKRLEAEAHN
jgi:hypothetical protein